MNLKKLPSLPLALVLVGAALGIAFMLPTPTLVQAVPEADSARDAGRPAREAAPGAPGLDVEVQTATQVG